MGETPVDDELSFRELTTGSQANVVQLYTTGASRWSSPGHPAEYDVARIRKAIKAPVGSKAMAYIKEHAPEWLPRLTRRVPLAALSRQWL